MHIKNFTRLSNSYFWYFSVLGLAIPFLAIFLEGRGFNSLQMGEILAVFTATKIIGPTFWAFMADKTGKKLPFIQLGATLSLVCFSVLFFVDGYWPILTILALFSLFWTGMQPQMEVLTLGAMRKSTKFYARIRLWGSVGFIVFALASGEVIGYFGSDSFIAIGFVILVGLWLSTLWLNETNCRTSFVNVNSRIIHKFLTANFILFFISGLLFQLSFGPYYSFFALYLRDLTYPSYAVGMFVSLAVVAEIVIFIVAGRLFKRFDAKNLLVLSIAITAARWFIMAYFGDNGIMLAISQLAHAASFGLYHSASMQFIQNHFNPNQQNRAQAVYVSGMYGIGGAIGAYLAGVYWMDGLGAQQTFIYAGYVALFASIIAFLMSNKKAPM
ncbi:MFS transporter [Thalassotalea sp. M1531]|uniref:MFS transporter n=1 Tax=Thalassotalea algicola TaxID=2716224 RepID=A0A7Y0LG32_9GAMM|nr:MFS transporter [Thalassotalea algicola]NMP33001.1 MFS transporter [Thalassotalea algicola]